MATRTCPEGEGTAAGSPRLGDAASEPRAHRPRLVTRREARQEVHGTSRVGQFNNRLAVAITRAVGTMWTAYLFVLIALVSGPMALAAFLRGDTLAGISWLSQSFLQLVLLPIIIVGQNVSSAFQDARAEADHESLTALQSLTVRQLEILERLEAKERER